MNASASRSESLGASRRPWHIRMESSVSTIWGHLQGAAGSGWQIISKSFYTFPEKAPVSCKPL